MEVLMKKTLATLFLTTFTAFGFAQAENLTANALEKRNFPTDSQTVERNGTMYLKMSAAESELPKSDENIMPGLGIGYRAAYGHHAADISTEGNRREIRDAKGHRTTNFSYTFPRANYLYYVSPQRSSSFYAGGGLGFGGMEQTTVIVAVEETTAEDGVVTDAIPAHDKNQEFYGMIANAAVGYEFGRLSGGAKTFVQLDVSQPTLATSRSGEFFGPKVSLSAGVGF